MTPPDPIDPRTLSSQERQAFETIIACLAMDDPAFAARMQARSSDGRWYRWARRNRRRPPFPQR